MKRTLIRVAAGFVVFIIVGAGGIGATAALRWDRTIAMEEPDLQATTDPEMIERGRYLAYGPAHCAYCHSSEETLPALLRGEEPPITGGFVIRMPLADLPTPNLTPDPETGIGRYTDGQIARMLRHNVKPNGQLAVPIMEFQDMSDEDIVAVLSFLRSQPPVRHEVPERTVTAIGKAVMTFVIRPIMPNGTPPRLAPPEEPTVERGEYVASAVAGCAACHTKRNLRDGSYVVPRFAGGFEMASETDPNVVFTTPNLTPDPETGHIMTWTEDMFVARFRSGAFAEGTHMPWPAYARMSDTDLRAVYRYLMSLEPYAHDVGPMVRTLSR